MNLDQIKLRFLNSEEFSREDLVRIFEENNSRPPDPNNSLLEIAEDENGKLVGFYVAAQPQLHAEPIYVAPEYRNTKLHEKLMEKAFERLEEIKGFQVYVFASTQKVSNLAQRFGFKELDYKVLVREF